MIRLLNYPIHKGKEAAAMKIVKSAQKCNPEQIANNMTSIVEQLKTTVESAAKHGDSFDSVERKTLKTVLQLGCQALEMFLALQGHGDLGEEVQTADGKFAQRNVRTAEDITAALFRDESDENAAKQSRPQPQNKNTTAHFPELAGDGEGGEVSLTGIQVGLAWLAAQVLARRRPGQVLIMLRDGQESLWKTMLIHFTFGARTLPILDILHALAYVWKAANLFEKDEQARRSFTRERLLKILRGEVAGVIQGLRSLGTRRGLKGDKLKSLRQICGYLEKNADRMRYDVYLRRGYPIASGVIEGACRHLVKDRMERSGMRWTLEGARSMLNVRAAFQSDHWQAFMDWHIAHEVNQIHPNRNLLQNYTPKSLTC